MARPILMPKPGQMTEECTLTIWRKAVGDPVHRGDVLFEIETDKSTMEVETFEEGVLLAQVAAEGETVPVNGVCGWIGQPGEALPETPAPVPAQPAAPSPAPSAPAPAASASSAASPSSVPVPATAGDVRISPRARRLAASAGIDPTSLAGSGPDGRIVERDVQAAIAAGPSRAASTPATGPAVPGEGAPRPMSRMRRVIAERLTSSWQTTPHFTVTVAADVTKLLALRAQLKAAGSSLTVTDFVLAATADTLAEFPDVNARTDGTSVWPRSRVHLGMAVSVPSGLVVPVIRDADTLTVAELHDRAAALAAAARAGTASVDDLTGSTFTVSNLGMYGVDEFSAIINPGEAAILAVSAAIPTPVAVDGRVEVRQVMKLTLSADHRIVDGAMGAQFTRALQARLEAADGFRLGAATPPEPARERFPDDPDWFDVVVLGAGTGGYSAAFRAAQLGLKVALVDADKIGGTCLHRGCIPTKAILESADLAHRVRDTGAGLGVHTTGVAIDYAAVAANKDAVVRRMWTGLKSLVGKNKVEWVGGRGRLAGLGSVRVLLHGADGTPGAGGERVLKANDVILATGSRVKSLPGLVPDGVRILTSDDVLRMVELPASLIVIGAGAVGAEFASAFHDLGTKVTLLEYLPSVVPLEDAEVSRELQRSFERRGISVITSARFDPASVVAGEDGVRITVGPEGGERAELTADAILVATGRAPNTEDLGLETTKAVLERGFVKVDGLMRTDEPHLWAIGDLVGGLLLAHTAAHEGLTAVHAIAGELDVHPMDYVNQPRATYTRPEIASVGLTEAQCAERGLPVQVGKVPFQAIAKAVIHGSREGFAKVIAHAETGAILGVHVIGPHATELIAEASLAAALGATVDQVGAATHPHPTLSEVLGEAAMAVRGRSINF
ncbi:MAG: dihydrolipoyl dehydrogenase [Candidatus Limnocylindrales bacterium]